MSYIYLNAGIGTLKLFGVQCFPQRACVPWALGGAGEGCGLALPGPAQGAWAPVRGGQGALPTPRGSAGQPFSFETSSVLATARGDQDVDGDEKRDGRNNY